MRNLRSGDYREHRTAVSTLLGLISRAYPCFSIKLKLVISNCRDGGRQFGSNSACGAENRKSRCAVSKKKEEKKRNIRTSLTRYLWYHSTVKPRGRKPHRTKVLNRLIYIVEKNEVDTTHAQSPERRLQGAQDSRFDLIRSHQPCIPLFQYKTETCNLKLPRWWSTVRL